MRYQNEKHRAELDRQAVVVFCRRHPIRRLSLFGSALRGDLGPDSDIDFLVEFDPRAKVSLFDVGGMAEELTEILGRRADLRTIDDLSRYFRGSVARSAELIYAA